MEIDGCCWRGSLPGSWRTNYCKAWLTHVLEESFVAGYGPLPEGYDFAGCRTQPSYCRTFYCRLQDSTSQCLAHQKFEKCISILDIQEAFSLDTADFRHWLSGLETRLPMINWKLCPVACLPAPLFLQITNNNSNWMLKCKFTHWMLDFMLRVTFQQPSAIETSTGICCTPSIYDTWCVLGQFYEHCRNINFAALYGTCFLCRYCMFRGFIIVGYSQHLLADFFYISVKFNWPYLLNAHSSVFW